jgi:hypothetical protein
MVTRGDRADRHELNVLMLRIVDAYGLDYLANGWLPEETRPKPAAAP